MTFQNQFNVSSKDYWYMKKPARALRLLAQVSLLLYTHRHFCVFGINHNNVY